MAFINTIASMQVTGKSRRRDMLRAYRFRLITLATEDCPSLMYQVHYDKPVRALLELHGDTWWHHPVSYWVDLCKILTDNAPSFSRRTIHRYTMSIVLDSTVYIAPTGIAVTYSHLMTTHDVVYMRAYEGLC